MIKALDKQSLIDIAIQTAGSVDAVFDLAVKNGLSITDELAFGQALSEVEVLDKKIASYYKDNRLVPATYLWLDNTMESGGIGYMTIEKNFKVS